MIASHDVVFPPRIARNAIFVTSHARDGRPLRASHIAGAVKLREHARDGKLLQDQLGRYTQTGFLGARRDLEDVQRIGA